VTGTMRTTGNVDGAEGVERIVKAALAELPLTGPLLLGAGAATERLAEALPSDRPLTIGDVDVMITESDLDDETTADTAARGPRVVRV
jgi:sporulation-control protein spo0M